MKLSKNPKPMKGMELAIRTEKRVVIDFALRAIFQCCFETYDGKGHRLMDGEQFQLEFVTIDELIISYEKINKTK